MRGDLPYCDAGGLLSVPVHLSDDPAELRRELARQSLLLDLSRALASELDLDRLLRTIVERTSEVLDADRCTLYIVDEERDEVWSRVALGDGFNEVRVPRQLGIVGHVATTGQTVNVPDAYEDPRFNRAVDHRTGYRTRTILCMPVRNAEGKIVAVLQVLNKRAGMFNEDDETLLATICDHAAIALTNASLLDAHRRDIAKSNVLLDVMRSLSTELEIDKLLTRIVAKTTEVMQADRSSLFLVDRSTSELWSKVAEGIAMREVRIPMGLGIAGYVATTGETVNIPDAYSDPRFNQEVDRRTGYRTRSILCMPMKDAEGAIVGVLQVLNKRGGAFTSEDEELLAAIGSQVVVAIDNARLFQDVVTIKNYNESVLRSMATGVVTLDMEGRISTLNPAAERILGFKDDNLSERSLSAVIDAQANRAFLDPVQHAIDAGEPGEEHEITFLRSDGTTMTFNLSAVPLLDHRSQQIGVVVVVEDISREQRLESTLTRVVSRQVAKQLVDSGAIPSVGGQRKRVTVLMSDIRDFTPMTERNDPEEVVAMLNEYFARMIRIVFRYEGTLDKLIGDAIMAVFGTPVAHSGDLPDPLRAVFAGIEMRRALARFNRERRAAKKNPIRIGIGISVGEAVAGAIGSEERLDFTVIGDTVNMAARLEDLTKTFRDHKLIFDEPVYEAVKHVVPCDRLPEVPIKGKRQPVPVFGVAEGFILSGERLRGELPATPSD
jgi:adenylate cyclase